MSAYTEIPFRIIGILTRYAFLCKRMTQFYPQLQVFMPKYGQKVTW